MLLTSSIFRDGQLARDFGADLLPLPVNLVEQVRDLFHEELAQLPGPVSDLRRSHHEPTENNPSRSQRRGLSLISNIASITDKISIRNTTGLHTQNYIRFITILNNIRV